MYPRVESISILPVSGIPYAWFCAVALACTSVFAEVVRTVGWEDLQVTVEFEDPFEALTPDQLMNLSIYARVQTMKEQAPSAVSEGMQKEAEAYVQKLRAEDVDVEGLLARREEIKQLRTQRARATNSTLDGVRIRMPGYALPLEFDGKQVTEFLLVPWVGACIHTPPPPPNQIVYVHLEKPISVASRFEPVWIEGRIQTGNATKELYLVDGTSDISISYSMSTAEVEPYRSGPQAEVRPAVH